MDDIYIVLKNVREYDFDEARYEVAGASRNLGIAIQIGKGLGYPYTNFIIEQWESGHLGERVAVMKYQKVGDTWYHLNKV